MVAKYPREYLAKQIVIFLEKSLIQLHGVWFLHGCWDITVGIISCHSDRIFENNSLRVCRIYCHQAYSRVKVLDYDIIHPGSRWLFFFPPSKPGPRALGLGFIHQQSTKNRLVCLHMCVCSQYIVVINDMNRWIKDMEYKLPLSMYQKMQCGILDHVSHPPCSSKF